MLIYCFKGGKKVEKNDQIYAKPELDVDSGPSLSLSPLCYTKDVAIAAIDGGIATATATVASLPRTPFTALLSVRCCLSSAVGLLERAVRKLSISRANLKYLVSKRDEFIEFIEESDQATGGIHRWFRQLELVNM